ncbi:MULTISPECIES: hypothetical protein [Enterobacteriaceae]|nr:MULTISPECIES: hypothetical protein [Enterobacteriaceae]MDT9046456.1 hypothetical protein [Escherichia coli]UOV84397.1 hypothetical protein MU320_29060 [Klebsiella pneumoniae]
MNAAQFARRRGRIERQHQGRRRQRELAHLVRDAKAALVIVERKVVGYRLPNGEMVCIKDRYRDEAAALQAMERMQSSNWNGHRVPVRAYHCEHCRGFHLTSQARNAA